MRQSPSVGILFISTVSCTSYISRSLIKNRTLVHLSLSILSATPEFHPFFPCLLPPLLLCPTLHPDLTYPAPSPFLPPSHSLNPLPSPCLIPPTFLFRLIFFPPTQPNPPPPLLTVSASFLLIGLIPLPPPWVSPFSPERLSPPPSPNEEVVSSITWGW